MNEIITNHQLPRMRTIRQAAAETGIAEYFVRCLVRDKKIVFVCAGRKYLVNLDSLIGYLTEGEGVQG